VKVYFNKRDQWVGHYYSDRYHYVCPLPCLVIRWGRRQAPASFPSQAPVSDVLMVGFVSDVAAKMAREYPVSSGMATDIVTRTFRLAEQTLIEAGHASLTLEERRAMKLTTMLWNTLVEIVGDGDTRDADLAELAHHVHVIQRTVGSQAVARAYPSDFRLLGETL
jgi:hypothetical protein